MDKQQKRALKKASHHLKPVVRLGQHGLSEGVINETKISLKVHELIKVHIHEGQREDRLTMAQDLAKACDAELIHKIGKNFTFYRKRENEG